MPRDVRTGLLLGEPRSIEESRPGEIRRDRKAAGVRGVFGHLLLGEITQRLALSSLVDLPARRDWQFTFTVGGLQ